MKLAPVVVVESNHRNASSPIAEHIGAEWNEAGKVIVFKSPFLQRLPC